MENLNQVAEQYLAAAWTLHGAWDAEDECFVFRVDELPDFFVAGDSLRDALADFREAFLSHLMGYLAAGIPIPAPRPRTIAFGAYGGGSINQLVSRPFEYA